MVQTIKQVILMPNGLVAVFDQDGQQVPHCQGKLKKVFHRIEANFADMWEVYAYYGAKAQYMTSDQVKSVFLSS